MGSVKKAILELTEALPEDCTLEDVKYQLYVRQKLERSMAAAAAGKVLTHRQAKRRLAESLER